MHDNMTALECPECGYILSKNIIGRTVEVMCPECKSYNVEIATTSNEIRLNLKTLRK